MGLGDSLCQLADQQSMLAAEASRVEHASLVDEIQGRSADLAKAVAGAEVQLEENQTLKQESQAFRGMHPLCHYKSLLKQTCIIFG